jgi:FkbM family methyltransferase
MSVTARLRNGMTKLRWGVGTVGAPATLRGLVRYSLLRTRGPAERVVRLRRSGVVLHYRHPAQTVPALVVFGDVIDPEYDFLRRVLRPGWSVVDVGAAIGQFSLFCAATAEVSVHAFEPSSANVAMLATNARLNGVAGQVAVHRVAVSNAPGEATFATADVTYVSGLSAGGEGERVRVDTLTAMCAELGIDHVHVLKINVAGHEPEVLEGALPLLARGGADILILLIGLPSLPWYGRLREMGYGLYFYEPKAGRLHEVTAFDEDGFLSARPSPARHVIAIRQAAVDLAPFRAG